MNVYRICVLGSQGTGKSSFLAHLGPDTHIHHGPAVTTHEKQFFIQGITIKLIIEELLCIDHPSLDQVEANTNQSTLKNYLNNTFSDQCLNTKSIYAYIFMYDLTKKASFLKIKQCLKYVSTYEEQQKREWITQKILVGNKLDMINECQQSRLLDECLQEVVQQYSLSLLFCSALHNTNVHHILQETVSAIYNDHALQQREHHFQTIVQDRIHRYMDTTQSTQPPLSFFGSLMAALCCSGRHELRGDSFVSLSSG